MLCLQVPPLDVPRIKARDFMGLILTAPSITFATELILAF